METEGRIEKYIGVKVKVCFTNVLCDRVLFLN